MTNDTKVLKDLLVFVGTSVYLIGYISVTYTLLALPFGDVDNLLAELTQQIDYPTYVAVVLLGINLAFMQFYPMYFIVKYFLHRTIWLKKKLEKEI